MKVIMNKFINDLLIIFYEYRITRTGSSPHKFIQDLRRPFIPSWYRVFFYLYVALDTHLYFFSKYTPLVKENINNLCNKVIICKRFFIMSSVSPLRLFPFSDSIYTVKAGHFEQKRAFLDGF